MSTHRIHIFISHSWAYSSHYETLCEWIYSRVWRFGQASLVFADYSVPKDDPIHDAPTEGALMDAILRKIARSHVVVIPTGMYATYSKWIAKEILGAGEKGKPILAVNPWGQQRRSVVVADAAGKIVGWNRQSVVGGIWELYRQ
ncbi:TIR domain-containing protein [Candidatus Palauibacter sp.]|uniref:TIR domain-containing protein n=1 Tax=Candidatus Palauibacter sp. TaxID=3101350 RepID=UPI003B5189EA